MAGALLRRYKKHWLALTIIKILFKLTQAWMSFFTSSKRNLLSGTIREQKQEYVAALLPVLNSMHQIIIIMPLPWHSFREKHISVWLPEHHLPLCLAQSVSLHTVEQIKQKNHHQVEHLDNLCRYITLWKKCSSHFFIF